MRYTITKKARGPVHRRKPGQGRHDYTPAGITEGGIVVLSPSTIAWDEGSYGAALFFCPRAGKRKEQSNEKAEKREGGRLKWAKNPFDGGTQVDGDTPAAVGRAAVAHFGLDDFVAAHARAATTGLSRMIPATVNHMARCIGSWHTQDEVIAMGINHLPYVQYCTMDCSAFDERDYPTFIEIASSISYVAVASYKYCVERMNKDEVTAWINQNVTYHPEIVREELLL